MERVGRIELPWPAWKAGTLPLSYTRDIRKSMRCKTAPSTAIVSILTHLREQIYADSPIHRKGSRTCNHQRDSGGNDQNRKLNAFESRGVLDEDQDASHNSDNSQGGKPSEEAKKERKAYDKLSDEENGSHQIRETVVVRTGPKRNRIIPSRPAEPAERLLNAMIEKHRGKRYPQEKGRETGPSGKKGIDGIT